MRACLLSCLSSFAQPTRIVPLPMMPPSELKGIHYAKSRSSSLTGMRTWNKLRVSSREFTQPMNDPIDLTFRQAARGGPALAAIAARGVPRSVHSHRRRRRRSGLERRLVCRGDLVLRQRPRRQQIATTDGAACGHRELQTVGSDRRIRVWCRRDGRDERHPPSLSLFLPYQCTENPRLPLLTSASSCAVLRCPRPTELRRN